MSDPAPSPGDASPPLFVFVHIPKTAGTTLTTVLRANNSRGGIRHVGNVFKGGGGTKYGATFDRLRDDGGNHLAGVRILTGHVPLGIRESFSPTREVRYFTFLRDPVERILSHLFQAREISQRRQGTKAPPLAADATLEEALAADHIHDNLHTRMLSGLPEPFGEVDEAMLEQAKRNLSEGLAFFGLTERFDESLVLAKRRLGLRTILYKPGASSASRGRVNSKRPRGNAIPPELRAAAEQANRYDIELYRYASELFEAQPELAELEFAVELAALRAAKAEGAIDLEVPAPEGFEGGEAAWRMLLEARARLERHEEELAEARAIAEELAHLDPAAAEQLAGLGGGGKRNRSRGARIALQAVQILVETPENGSAKRSPQDGKQTTSQAAARSSTTPIEKAGGSRKRKTSDPSSDRPAGAPRKPRAAGPSARAATPAKKRQAGPGKKRKPGSAAKRASPARAKARTPRAGGKRGRRSEGSPRGRS